MYTAALIGCGRMGAFPSEKMRQFAPMHFAPFSHAEAIMMHEGINLAGLCDASNEALDAACERYSVGARFTDHHSMLSELRPDIVCIATRAPGRTKLIADCIDAGVRALHIEKPLCNSKTELNELRRYFDSGVFVTLGAARRHMAIFRGAVDLAWEGALGKPLDLRIAMGGLPLYWTHPHSVDLILMAARGSPVVDVQARLDKLEGSEEADHYVNDPAVFAASIRFANGFAGHIGRPPGFEYRLSCERGIVSILRDGEAMRLSQFEGQSPYLVDTMIDKVEWRRPQGIYAPLAHLARCLDGDEVAITENETIRIEMLTGQEVLFSMAYSHVCGGCPVAPVDVPSTFRLDGKTGALFA